MAMTALNVAYELDDEGVSQLIAMQEAGSAPVATDGFVSQLASAERLRELSSLLAARTA